MNPVVIADKKNGTISVFLKVQQIKLNKERKRYYYTHDIVRWLEDAGYKLKKCLKAAHVVDNVSNLSGTWIFSMDLPKKTKAVAKPKRKKVEFKTVSPPKMEPKPDAEPEPPLVRRRRRRRKVEKNTE
jgi:hypothetical protein|tara:strand:- start:5207 stop:5590 length:384 start_codon:yes stop_codon:yes gene_type:complete